MPNYYLAIDIGASSGRHILFWLENGQMRMEEVYRFPNGMEEQNGSLCWNYSAMEQHILIGMRRCAEIGKIPVSVGIDTWGVDFVLLDAQDNILGETVGYRDRRTEGMDVLVSEVIPLEKLYARTGIQKAAYNTIYQLMAVKQTSPEQLGNAKTFLMVPDYFHWKLCGVKANEYTEATTTQLIDPAVCDWDRELIERLGYPVEIFQKVVQPGTVLGELTDEVSETIGYRCKVILPAAHDTASAILAMPSTDPDTVYISSGTWSLLGVELDAPDRSDSSRRNNFTNEGGFGGKTCYLTNIMGLWMIQSLRKELLEQGVELSFAELCTLAERESIPSIIPCNHDRFLSPDSMIGEIQRACAESEQMVPQTPAQLAAVVYHSLAACYGEAVSQLRESRGKSYNALSIIGGGGNAAYLNRLTAETTGCTVYAGPGEATAIGNAAAQMFSFGELNSVSEVRRCVRSSFDITVVQNSKNCES